MNKNMLALFTAIGVFASAGTALAYAPTALDTASIFEGTVLATEATGPVIPLSLSPDTRIFSDDVVRDQLSNDIIHDNAFVG